jgi:hypothetical protein
MAMYHVYDVE